MLDPESSQDKEARLYLAVRACPPLGGDSPQKQKLWMVLDEVICTHGRMSACPYGSTRPQRIGGADSHQIELAAAMEWLIDHEGHARAMTPTRLYRTARRAATAAAAGAVKADSLHGITDVSPGTTLRFYPWKDT